MVLLCCRFCRNYQFSVSYGGGVAMLTEVVQFIGQAIVYAQHPDKTANPKFNVVGSIRLILFCTAIIIIAGGFNA